MESSLKQFNRPNISSETFFNTPVITSIPEEFWINFEDAKFMAGQIIFTKHIKQLNKSFEFKISNEHLLPAFENIKGWFSKKLKTKKFYVKAAFTLINGTVDNYTAESDEIKMINKDFIDSIKLIRTISICERPRLTTNKALFTKDEIFSVLSEDGLEENIFNQTEKEIVDLLSNRFNIRNRPQLDFLSAEKQSESHPIKYTTHPNFGFLFTLIHDHNCYFIWELLNSHATYIWKMNTLTTHITDQIKQVEKEISLIKDLGREKYKKETLGKSNDRFFFQVINHKKSHDSSTVVFDKWKNDLQKILI